MGRIKIGDLPEDQKISKEEMRKVVGGAMPLLIPYSFSLPIPPPKGFDVFVPDPWGKRPI